MDIDKESGIIEESTAELLNASTPCESLVGSIEMIKQILENHLGEPTSPQEFGPENFNINPRMDRQPSPDTISHNTDMSTSFYCNIPEGQSERSRQCSFSDNGSTTGSDTLNSKNMTVKIKIINVSSAAVNIGNHNRSFVSTGSDIENISDCDPDNWNTSDHGDFIGDENSDSHRPQFDLHSDTSSEDLDSDSPTEEDRNLNPQSPPSPKKRASPVAETEDKQSMNTTGATQNKQFALAKEYPVSLRPFVSKPQPEPRDLCHLTPCIQQGHHPGSSSGTTCLNQLAEQTEYTCLLTQPYHPIHAQEGSHYTTVKTDRLDIPKLASTKTPQQSNATSQRFVNPIYSTSLPAMNPQFPEGHHPCCDATVPVTSLVATSSNVGSEHGFFDDMSLDHQYLSMGQTRTLLQAQSSALSCQPLTEQMIQKARKTKGFYACFNSHSNKEIHAVLKQKKNQDGRYVLWQANTNCFVVSVIYLQKVFNFKICTDGYTLFLNKEGPRAVDLPSLVSLYIKEKITLSRSISEESTKDNKDGCQETRGRQPPLPPKPANGFLRLVEPVVLDNTQLHNILRTIRRQHSSHK